MRSLLRAAVWTVLFMLFNAAHAVGLSDALRDDLGSKDPGFVCERDDEFYASRSAGPGCTEALNLGEAQLVAARRSAEAFNARQRTAMMWIGGIGFAVLWWLYNLVRRRKRQIVVGTAELAGKVAGKAANVAESTAHAAGAASVKVERGASSLADAFKRGRDSARSKR